MWPQISQSAGMRRDDICICVSPANRARLEGMIADRNSPSKVVWRANIVLATADGVGTNAIMRRTGKSKPCVWRWQELQHLPGVGQNFQDHFMSPCVWEANGPVVQRNNLAEATAIWKSDPSINTPDLQTIMVERPYASPQASKSALPPDCWSLTTAVLRTESRGRLHLTGARPTDPIEIDANALDDPADIKALKTCVDFCRTIGNSVALRPSAVPTLSGKGAITI
jgi:choline dehydrogenase-like flavoprotein